MPNWKIINATFWVIFKHCAKCHNCHFFECYEVLIFGQFLTKLYVFFQLIGCMIIGYMAWVLSTSVTVSRFLDGTLVRYPNDHMSCHIICWNICIFSDIYLRRHRTGFHPLLFGVDWMGWWGLGKSLPSQTFFVLRCGIHDCGNWRNYFTQHCEIRGTNTLLENHKLCPKTPF